jgi:hypothetical protein
MQEQEQQDEDCGDSSVEIDYSPFRGGCDDY